MKNTFKFKRNIAKGSSFDCVMLFLSLATLANSINIPFVSKTLFFFFTFMALHIAFVQIRHKLHKNKRVKIKNTIQA